MGGDVYYCCPCEGADAGAAAHDAALANALARAAAGGAAAPDGGACVNIDLSTYDRSCTTTEDCIRIQAGTVCSDTCACGNASVNADGQARYQQTIAPLGPTPACGCPNEPVPKCVQGQCR